MVKYDRAYTCDMPRELKKIMITGCDLCVCNMFFNDLQKQSPKRHLQEKVKNFKRISLNIDTFYFDFELMFISLFTMP